MYTSIRNLLFRLKPETVHQITLQALRLAGNIPLSHWLLTQIFKAPSRPVQAFGLTFKNPVGLAAGYDKDAIAVQGFSTLGFGHVEVGTVTPRPQPGNPRPRVFRLPEDEALINRMGFPGKGADYMVRSLRSKQDELSYGPGVLRMPSIRDLLRRTPSAKFRNDMLVGVNIGKNKDTPNEEAVLDYLDLLQRLAPHADYLAINISSPNTVGLRQLQGRDALEGLLKQLHIQRTIEEGTLEKRIPLLVKLAPDLTEQELDDAVDVILATHMDGIIATNTTIAREGLRSMNQGETGGLSGAPLRLRSEAALRQIVARVNGQIPIVGVGGIMTPDDAKRRLDLGATLIQIYTGLIYQGPYLVKKILKH